MANDNADHRQKAGDVFPPCKACTENCYRTHGKQKDKESFDGCFCSYFFKVMLGEFAKRLRIPPAFVPMLRDETHENMALEGPSGHQWIVKLLRSGTEMEFTQGWDSFVRDHAIELGDFLVFKYISRSYFQVRIFGRSGCEKNITVFEPEKSHCKRCSDSPTLRSFQQPMNSKLPVDFFSEQEEKNEQAEAAVPKAKSSSSGRPKKKLGHCQVSLAGKKNQTPKSAKTENGEKSYQGSFFVSCRRPVTEAERKKALEAAKSFTSNKPFYLLLMKPSNVYQGFWLNIPKNCGDLLRLPRERTEVILVDPNNKEWDVKYLGDRSCPGMSGGWKSLSLDNNLEEGDVCIFERVHDSKSKFTIRVHIFRVVKKCTPYKRMEGSGRGISDSIETPTKHSNKKSKTMREVFSISLSAKVFEPKQGKDTNQVPVKKEKVSNGSNCRELAEPKCSPSISESPHRSRLMKDLSTVESIVQAESQENPSCNFDALLLEAATFSIDTNAEPNLTTSSEGNGDIGSPELT